MKTIMKATARSYSIREDYDSRTAGAERPLTAYVDIELPNTWGSQTTVRVPIEGYRLEKLLNVMDELVLETIGSALSRDDDALIGGCHVIDERTQAVIDAEAERLAKRIVADEAKARADAEARAGDVAPL